MKTVKAWAIVDRDDGSVWCDATYKTRQQAVAILGAARKAYRIARVEIREVRK